MTSAHEEMPDDAARREENQRLYERMIKAQNARASHGGSAEGDDAADVATVAHVLVALVDPV